MLSPDVKATAETAAATSDFVDRRQAGGNAPDGRERRQFASSHTGLSPDARELADAIDNYKLQRRRRYLTFEEMLFVIRGLGYNKDA